MRVPVGVPALAEDVQTYPVFTFFGGFLMVAATLTDSLKNALTFTSATQLFSPVPSVASLLRWHKTGVMVNGKRERLSAWKRGGVWTTTPAAVEDFLRRLNSDAADTGAADDFAKRSTAEKRAALASL